MTEHSGQSVDTLVVGAGPYGLSVASYLSFLEIPYQVVGIPLEFWHTHMMEDAQLRSTLEHTCPSNPDGLALLSNWVTEYAPDIDSRPLATLYPYEFRDFMGHFSEHFHIPIEHDHVRWIEQTDRGFLAQLNNGKWIAAEHVVFALGLGGMEHTPAWCKESESSSPILHSARIAGVEWRGKTVLVIGAGQSAAETALLAVRKGAESVEMVFRTQSLVFNSMHSEFTLERKRRLFRVKNAYQYSDAEFRVTNIDGILPTSIEPGLENKLSAAVGLRNNSEVVSVVENKNGTMDVEFSAGESKSYDCVVCATGYKPMLSRFPLELKLRKEIRAVGQLPDLSECAESSVEGMFFVGTWAATRFGPQSNFVYGSHQMVPRVIGRVARFGRRPYGEKTACRS